MCNGSQAVVEGVRRILDDLDERVDRASHECYACPAGRAQGCCPALVELIKALPAQDAARLVAGAK